jgi:hypothetical protein
VKEWVKIKLPRAYVTDGLGTITSAWIGQ